MSKKEPSHTYGTPHLAVLALGHISVRQGRYADYSFGTFCLLIALIVCDPVFSKERSIDNSLPHWAAAEMLRSELSDVTRLDVHSISGDATIACHAVWRRFELADRKSKNADKRGAVEGPEYVLGFLESRARVIAPQWWRDTIIAAYKPDVNKVAFKVEDDALSRRTIDDLALPRGAAGTMRSTGDLEITARGRKVVLPAKVVADGRANSSAIGVEVTFSPDSPVVAWCGGHGSALLMRVGPGGEKWSAMARGHWAVSSFSGPGEYQRVELVVQDQLVALFGASNSVMYVEVFDLESGLRQFRFSTDACGF